MESISINTPVCMSHYFVNKQNMRSYGNILKWNILKESTAEEFYKYLCIDGDTLSKLSSDFLVMLSILKLNLQSKCKNDFREYFSKKDTGFLQPVDKEYIFENSWKLLCEIIPRTFFECKLNNNIFKNLVRTMVFTMKRQHHLIGKLADKWDLSVQIWKNISNPREILLHIILFILKYILAPIICLNFYVTTSKLDYNENKLYYFWKHHWQSFYDKQLSKMIYTKVIKKYVCYSTGKRVRKNHSLANKIKLNKLQKDIPKLLLLLKANNESRPIVCYKNNALNTSEKYKIIDRLKFLRSLNEKATIKLESQYSMLYTKWINKGQPKLYFIKTDLSNAFGSINREKLGKILFEKYIHLLKTETSVSKKKTIAQLYKDMVLELRKPILIRAGSTVYEWKEGLVQGYKYSPALSELYYSYLDAMYFSKHLQIHENDLRLFIRVVDDYLYITDSYDDAKSFIEALSNYRNVNYDKTVVNFAHEGIRFEEKITFLGHCYNTVNMQVGRASNIYAGQMCYKIAFTNGLSDLNKFIESRIGQSGIPINRHIFNLNYNTEEIIWQHVFTTYCLSANKFCTILAIICEENEMKVLLKLYKNRVTVKLTITILEVLMKTKPANFMFMYCINHYRYLSWKALSLCAMQTPKCTGLVPLVKDELVKTNCIFGKWKDHASRMNSNGDCLRKAIQEICRQVDLRAIFRGFETLPTGFECYHHRRKV